MGFNRSNKWYRFDLAEKEKGQESENDDEEEDDDNVVNGFMSGYSGSKKKKVVIEDPHITDAYLQAAAEEIGDNLSLPKDREAIQKEEIEHQKLCLEKDLVEAALLQVEPRKQSFKLQFPKLDYQEMAKHVPSFTPEQCHTKLKKLVARTSKLKCLNQILSEALVFYSKKEPKRSPFTLFFKENKEAIDKAYEEGRGRNKMIIASILWRELSEEERKSYDRKTETIPKNGQSPFEIFYAKRKIKKPSFEIAAARQKWAEMEFERKIKYIELSLQINTVLRDKYNHIDQLRGTTTRRTVKAPNKDLAEEYLRYKGMPPIPLRLPALLYYQDSLSQKREIMNMKKSKKLFYALRMYRKLSLGEKDKWIAKYNQNLDDFREQYDEWKEEQNELVKNLCDKYPPVLPPVRRNKYRRTLQFLKKVPAPPDVQIQRDAPPMPPLSAFQLFKSEMQKVAPEMMESLNLLRKFRALDTKTKNTLVAKSQMIRDKYVKILRSFVASMSEEERKVFLGFRRSRFIQHLRRDIWKMYPLEQYPIFIQENASRSWDRDCFGPEEEGDELAEFEDEDIQAVVEWLDSQDEKPIDLPSFKDKTPKRSRREDSSSPEKENKRRRRAGEKADRKRT